MDIKIRYTWKRKKDKFIEQSVYTIDAIENDPPDIPHKEWDLIARDLFTGRVDRNGNDIYMGDKLKWHVNDKIYTMGFNEGLFDLIDFNCYDHDWPIAFNDAAQWEIVGNIHPKQP